MAALAGSDGRDDGRGHGLGQPRGRPERWACWIRNGRTTAHKRAVVLLYMARQNGQLAGKTTLIIPTSRTVVEVRDILEQEITVSSRRPPSEPSTGVGVQGAMSTGSWAWAHEPTNAVSVGGEARRQRAKTERSKFQSKNTAKK